MIKKYLHLVIFMAGGAINVCDMFARCLCAINLEIKRSNSARTVAFDIKHLKINLLGVIDSADPNLSRMQKTAHQKHTSAEEV